MPKQKRIPDTLEPVRLSAGPDALSVASLRAEAIVDGPVSLTTLVIVFKNDLGRTVEGDLVFPLPAFAALCELEVRVGKRTIEGKIKARDRARAEFTRAIESGRTAALGETEGEDLARLRIAPIADGEDVTIELGLLHALLPTDRGHRLVLPLTYMPRFVEDPKALKEIERAALERVRPLTLAARAEVTITVAHSGGRAPRLKSASHRTTVKEELGASVVTVGPTPLDRDLVLEIDDRAAEGKPEVWLRHDPSDGPDGSGPTTALAIVPPAFAEEGPTIARTITFLVDRSGSMNGGPMASAIRAVRGCLRAIEPKDYFNIVAFDDRLEVLSTQVLPFDDEALIAADAFVSSITARGGTHASAAITAALSSKVQGADRVAVTKGSAPFDGDHRLRVVVLLTDGDVAGAQQVLETAKDKLLDTRLFVIGIGDSVNHAMLAALASAGGGAYIPVATDEDLENALTRLKNAINTPLWTGIKLVLERDGDRRTPKQLEPSGPIDVFGGQATLLAFRGPLQEDDRIVLTGQRSGGEDLRVVVGPPKRDDASTKLAPLVWALLKNRRLSYRFDAEDDETLEALGTTFGITNRKVGLVGVHAEDRNLTIEGSVAVNLPMPRNIADAFGASMMGVVMAAPPPAPGGMPPMMGGYGGPPPPAPPPPPPGMGMVGGFGPPPRPVVPGSPARMAPPPMVQPAVMRSAAPMPASVSVPDRAPPPAALTNDEAGLRTLLLRQGADGLFAGDLGVTLAAVAALVTAGHTHREGLFRAELRRTVATLKSRLASGTTEERSIAALALGLLFRSSGEDLPAELAGAARAAVEALPDQDRPDIAGVKAALATAPKAWAAHAMASEIARAFAFG